MFDCELTTAGSLLLLLLATISGLLRTKDVSEVVVADELCSEVWVEAFDELVGGVEVVVVSGLAFFR